MDHLCALQRDFINLRLGTFIHWNSAAVQFHANPDIIDWEYDHENGDLPRQFPFDEKDFNPTAPEYCKQWASIAKSAGCQFAALTSKHHEGFDLWPSDYTEHCVKNATNKTDVVAAYLDAFRREGIVAGLYFSVLDLTAQTGHRSCTAAQKEKIFGQVTELLTRYGEIPFLIVDGWNAPWGGPSYEMLPFEELDHLVKSLQPDCMLMNIGCSDGVNGTDVVFYENSAGQEADSSFCGPGVSCNKLTKTWFWREDDPNAELTSAQWAVQKAQDYFPMNINFMLNLSPNTEGRLDQNLVNRFEEIGRQIKFPAPLASIPQGWQMRTKTL